MHKLQIAVLATLLVAACSPAEKKKSLITYPVSEKGTVVDTLFGTMVADPYRWMEDDTAAATANWVKAQNDVTFGFLDKIPYREALKTRLQALYNYERLSAPFKEGNYYYFYKNDGLQNQSVLYRKTEEKG
ncbi:MAG: S9 family peptidase, partial [Cyclobacteriaceae bacterium]